MEPLRASHFTRWQADKPEPLHIEADGRIWGHVNSRGACLRGGRVCRPMPDGLVAGFHVGAEVPLDNGETIRTGPLTFGGLHAATDLSMSDVQRFRNEDATGIVARLIAWADPPHGIAVTGSLVPGLSETVIAQLATAAPSVELWPNPQRGNQLELVGIHVVPVPASPVAAAAECGCDGSCGGGAPVEDAEPSKTDLELVTDAISHLASLINDRLPGAPTEEPEVEEAEDEKPSGFAALAKILANSDRQ